MRILLGMLVLALAVPAGGARTAAATSGATHVIRYAPAAANGALAAGYRVTSRVRGSCWTGSIAAQRADAWRCMVGNDIHDPCYAASTSARVVYCPTSNITRLLAIALTKPLPLDQANRGGTAQALPTMIRLVGGATCWFETGASGAIGNMRMNYDCSDGRVLVGEPDRRAPLWRIRAARNGSRTTTFATIDTAVL